MDVFKQLLGFCVQFLRAFFIKLRSIPRKRPGGVEDGWDPGAGSNRNEETE